MNDTPQGDGNSKNLISIPSFLNLIIRMNDTPQGDGNSCFNCFTRLLKSF